MNLIRIAAIAAVAMMITMPSAKAQAAKVNVTGKWLFNVETGGGSGTPRHRSASRTCSRCFSVVCALS